METVDVDHVTSWIQRDRTRRDGVASRPTGDVAETRYVFGLAGPPGCGKSTIAARLGAEIGAPVVGMDGFHLPNEVLRRRGLLDVKGAPDTFAAADFVALVRRLRDATSTVSAPVFDRSVDEPVDGGVIVTPDDTIVLVEGNYLLLDTPPWASIVALADAVAYVDVDRAVRVERLIARHVEFGRSPSEAVAFVERSDECNTARIEASRHRATITVAGR